MMKKLLLLLILFSEPAFALDAEHAAQEVSDTTMSPFCPGRTISACPSSEARNLRDRIKAWFEQGYSEQAVRNQLTMIYGNEVTGKPKSEGIGLLAWIIPIVFVLLGAVLISRKVESRKEDFKETNLDPEIQLELDNRLRN